MKLLEKSLTLNVNDFSNDFIFRPITRLLIRLLDLLIRLQDRYDHKFCGRIDLVIS